MNLSEFLARRAAQNAVRYRDLCPRCRKSLPTCYCAQLRPFAAPAPFIILQHEAEARNAIATARMAHLSITNSHLIVGRHFQDHPVVQRLLADDTQRHVLLYPSVDALPIETLFREQALPGAKPVAFWVLDAKWSQVPKMLRLSPNVRAIPMVKFAPAQASCFQIRKQPDPAYLSTIEAIFLVIDRLRQLAGSDASDHQALMEIFRHFVRQQLGFVDPSKDTRHKVAKQLRLARRARASQLALKQRHPETARPARCPPGDAGIC